MAGIFGDIERLINEHGSAVILKERLALADDKYAALEAKVRELEDENRKLKDQVKTLQNEKAALEQMTPKGSAGSGGMEEDSLRILAIFFRRQDTSLEVVGHEAGLGVPMVEYHFDLLREAGFIQQTFRSSMGCPSLFRITPEGRKYVVKNKIA